MRLLLFALLVASTTAAAGTAEDPEATDPTGDAVPPYACTDVTAAWAEADDAGNLTLRMRVAECSDPPAPSTYWNLDFRIGGTRYFSFAYWSPDEGYAFWHGERDDAGPVTKERGEFEMRPGAPAEIVIPYSPGVATLPKGEALHFEMLAAGLWTSQIRFDEAEASRPFVRGGGATTPASAPEKVVAAQSSTEPDAEPAVADVGAREASALGALTAVAAAVLAAGRR